MVKKEKDVARVMVMLKVMEVKAKMREEKVGAMAVMRKIELSALGPVKRMRLRVRVVRGRELALTA